VEELANKIHAVLTYKGLSAELLERCREEMIEVTWENAATRIMEVTAKRKDSGDGEQWLKG